MMETTALISKHTTLGLPIYACSLGIPSDCVPRNGKPYLGDGKAYTPGSACKYLSDHWNYEAQNVGAYLAFQVM